MLRAFCPPPARSHNMPRDNRKKRRHAAAGLRNDGGRYTLLLTPQQLARIVMGQHFHCSPSAEDGIEILNQYPKYANDLSVSVLLIRVLLIRSA